MAPEHFVSSSNLSHSALATAKQLQYHKDLWSATGCWGISRLQAVEEVLDNQSQKHSIPDTTLNATPTAASHSVNVTMSGL